MNKLKTSALAAICACSLALALPAIAQAAPSPTMSTTNPVTDNGITLQIQYAGQAGALAVEATDDVAANVPEGTEPKSNFKVTESSPGAIVGEDGTIAGGLMLAFDAESSYAGYAATIYIDHDNGSDEVKKATADANGDFSVSIDRLSVYSIVLDAPQGDASKNIDTTASSPTTGTDAAPMALMAGLLCLGGAAVCLKRTRKED